MHLRSYLLIACLLAAWLAAGTLGFQAPRAADQKPAEQAVTPQREPPTRPPTRPQGGPFGLSLMATPDGKPADALHFATSEDCSACHARHVEEFDGSLHSFSHHDPLYRAFAELARKEAGEQVYAYCSGCHAPAAVVSGLVPGTPEDLLPDNVKAGVQCDICHQVRELNGAAGPWGEPGNGSLTLEPGKAKASIRPEIKSNLFHTARRAEFLESSEFCASCHTVIHPFNGLRIEHTYDEWKKSIYAEKGIQCQDCHMRTVEDAVRVAQTLEPVTVMGKTSELSGTQREISPHTFVGGNIEAGRLTGSEAHGQMAEARLKSAAVIAVESVERAADGRELSFTVAVTNVGAGHSLPTSLTELREMWLHVRVSDSQGGLVFESGALDGHGELSKGSVRFGSVLHDAGGKPTFKPWEGVSFGKKRLIPAKGTERERFTAALAAAAPGALSIEARLCYRIAAPHVVKAVMGEQAFEPRIVEMASARASVP
jgi:hypothetical protein